MAERHTNQPEPIPPLKQEVESAAHPPSDASASDSHAPRGNRYSPSGEYESISRENITLMKRIRARDETALEELYDRYSRAVYAIARHILWQTADAEEVVADTFWEVWQKADRYDPSRGSVVSYIMLLARSRAIDRSRQVRSRNAVQNRMQTLELNSASTSEQEGDQPEDDVVLLERRSHVRDLLAELPPERREVIELSFLKGLSHQQISEALDIPLGTIKTRIRQGLIQLYEQLRIRDRGPSL